MDIKFLVAKFVILAISLSAPAAAEIDCKAHPDSLHPHTCCPIPDLISNAIKEKCEEFIAPLSPMVAQDDNQNPNDVDHPRLRTHPRPHPHLGLHSPHHSCLMSCLFNETDILNAEQQLDEDKLSGYLVSVLENSNEEFLLVLQNSFKTCSVKAEEIHTERMAKKAEKMSSSSDIKPRRKFSPRCPMKAGLLAGCVFMETFQNCPSSLWKDNEQCNGLRDFMKVCQPPRAKWHKKRFTDSSSKDDSL